MNLPAKIRHRRRSAVSHRAAEMVLDELMSAQTAGVASADPRAVAAGADPPELAAELDAIRALALTLQQVPGEAWEAELGGLASEHAEARHQPRLPVRRQSRHPARRHDRRLNSRVQLGAGALLAMCLAAAFFVGSVTHPTLAGTGRGAPRASHSAASVTLRPLTQATGSGLAVAYMRGSGRMSLLVRRLRPSPPGTYYELWLMTSDTDLVSVASFRVGATGTADLSLALPAEPSNYEFLDISLQRVSAGVTISQDNVLRGTISS